MTDIQELRKVIHGLHGGTATHLESVPVKETFRGKMLWDGIVEVFSLKGHPEADKVYAWMHDTDAPANSKRHVTVLHIPTIVWPKTAVQAAIIQEYRDAN